jgi:hypothetical protein
LKAIVIDERRLYRMENIPLCKSFNSDNLLALLHHSQGETGVSSLSIDEDCTGSTLTVIAALFAACEFHTFAQGIQQGYSWLDSERSRLTITVSVTAISPSGAWHSSLFLSCCCLIEQ